jgi:drug/metabolite transporter (DMT)-like permease
MKALRIEGMRPWPWLAQVAVLTLLWAAIEAFGAAIGRHYDATQTVGMRYAVQLLLLLILFARLGLKRMLVTQHLVSQLARGACMAVMPLTFMIAASRVPITTAWAIFWVAPVAIAVCGATILKEYVPPKLWFLVMAGYAGSILSLEPSSIPIRGAFWPLAMAASFVIYVVLSRRLRTEWIGASLFYTTIVALAAMSPLMVLSWHAIHTEDIAPISGLGASGLAFLYLLDRALERAEIALLAPFLYGAVVWDKGFVSWSFGMPHLVALGGVAIMLAVIVMLATEIRGSVHD